MSWYASRALVAKRNVPFLHKAFLTFYTFSNVPTVTTKKGVSIDKVDIHVFDETSESTIILWGSQTLSATFWQASHTILLLTDIGVRSSSRTLLSIDQKTLVDVNPDIPDAYWLRTFAEGLVKRQHVNPPFPEEGISLLHIPVHAYLS